MLYEDYNDAMGLPDDQDVRAEVKRRDDSGRKKAYNDHHHDHHHDHEHINGGSEICKFCGISDPNFKDPAKYDMHLWKECPVLVECKKCALVVEIKNYTDHLLHECKYAHQFKEVKTENFVIFSTFFNFDIVSSMP